MNSPIDLGDSTLYVGDCLQVLNSLNDGSVDMVFADPPYNLSNDGTSVRSGARVSVNKGDWDRSRGLVKDYEFHYQWIQACRRVLKPDGTIWISGTYHSIHMCGYALQMQGWRMLNDIVWYKPNAAPNIGCRHFTASHEILLWAAVSPESKHVFNYQQITEHEYMGDVFKRQGKQMRSVWVINPPSKAEKRYGKHPTQKPEALMERVIRSSSHPGDVVLDPFCGSGTTGVTAVGNGRRFIGIDSNAEYVHNLATPRLLDASNHPRLDLAV